MMKKPELPIPPAAPVTRPPPPATPLVVRAPRPAPRVKTPALGGEDNDRLCDAPMGQEAIIGVGDRAPHLAMVARRAVLALRRPVVSTAESLHAPRPSSRPACERRCGKAGQCDPSSPFGCGGEFCQGFEGRLY